MKIVTDVTVTGVTFLMGNQPTTVTPVTPIYRSTLFKLYILV